MGPIRPAQPWHTVIPGFWPQLKEGRDSDCYPAPLRGLTRNKTLLFLPPHRNGFGFANAQQNLAFFDSLDATEKATAAAER
jgi:hypothetical protein